MHWLIFRAAVRDAKAQKNADSRFMPGIGVVEARTGCG
jgi:hypothetical protein